MLPGDDPGQTCGGGGEEGGGGGGRQQHHHLTRRGDIQGREYELRTLHKFGF